MLLARLHRRALNGVQRLSTIRSETFLESSEFQNAPISSPSHWSSVASDANACTRIVCMSDTHGKHADIPFLPPGDVLVHAGDFTKYGEIQAVRDLSQYFQIQKETYNFQDVICCAGNHDLTFQEGYYENTWSRHIRSTDPSEAREALQNCTYLEDSSTVLPGNVVAHGSPWTPDFFQWAFNLPRGEALQQVWSKIPASTDVLVTHGPPYGRGDITLHSGHFGCAHLLFEVQHRVKPRVHIYGHIHEGHGTSFDGHTLYVNASSLDLGYEANNPCIVIDLPHDKTKPAMVVEPHCWVHDTDDLLCWLKQNNYMRLAKRIEDWRSQTLPIGKGLFAKSAFQTICDKLFLHRRKHRLAKQELRVALCQLYAESFL